MVTTAMVIPVLWGLFIAIEWLRGRFRPAHGSRREALFDLVSWVQAWFVVSPLVVLGSAALHAAWLPDLAGSLAGTVWWKQVIAFLLLDDLVQYWVHRSCHRWPALWGLHRLHHGPYMGARVIWRNGFFYDLLQPNLWLAGTLVYLGYGEVYFWYYLTKMTVQIGAHSSVPWDAVLYRHRALAPLAWIIERTISTPATHYAHHAATEADGIGHYHGNFGSLLFFWDVLFGTAHITRRYPARFGVDPEPGAAPDHWSVLLFYPLIRSKPAAESAGAAVSGTAGGSSVIAALSGESTAVSIRQ